MRTLITARVALAGLCLVTSAMSGHGGTLVDRGEMACAPMSCGACGHKMCRVVRETKKVKKTVWVVECEEFCVPNPRCPTKLCGRADDGETACGKECRGCAMEEVCCRNRPLVPPRCGPVRCRKKLTKKTITFDVPVYRCVVCGSCCNPCGPSGGKAEVAPTKKGGGKQALLPAPMPASWNPRMRAPR